MMMTRKLNYEIDDEINKKKRNIKSYCAAGGKKFNSEKEKKNHEWSKKH